MYIFLLLSTILAVVRAYKLDSNFSGSTFFDNFNFFTDDDPTHGYVNYVSASQAWADGLIYAADNKIIIGSDDWSVASGRGRNSLRIQSNKAWNSGLFILDVMNMPTGCGTWPAWWMVGGPLWPFSGEIDILEGVNLNTQDQTTLHTADGCVIDDTGVSFSGTWAKNLDGGDATNCFVNATDQGPNAGCAIIGSGGSYGQPFNNDQGGVYAMEWTSDFIRAFFFPRSKIPADITNGDPDPSGWGEPYAYFALGKSCTTSHFKDMNMVFDLTFCGDWAGAVFESQCPGKGTCQSYVQNNPKAFAQAYWWVKSVTVYQ